MPYEPGEDGHDEQGPLPSEERGSPILPSPSTHHWCGPTHMGVSEGVDPHPGEVRRNWKALSGGLPRWGSRSSAHDLCGVAEGLEALWPRGVEAPAV